MRSLFTLTALLAVTASAAAFAKSPPSTASVLANANAARRLAQQPAPLISSQAVSTTASAASTRQDRIDQILDAAEARRRPRPSSP